MRSTHRPARAIPLVVASLLIAPLAAGAQTNAMPMHGSPSQADIQFMRHASETNVGEIASGQLAERRGTTAAVRMLGKRYVDNHTTNEATLTALAEQYGVTLPMHPSGSDRMQMQHLETLDGMAFDRAFLAGEQHGHEKAIAAFKREVNGGSAPAVVAYAKETLPVLDEHLLLATDDADRLAMSNHGMTSNHGMMSNDGTMSKDGPTRNGAGTASGNGTAPTNGATSR